MARMKSKCIRPHEDCALTQQLLLRFDLQLCHVFWQHNMYYYQKSRDDCWVACQDMRIVSMLMGQLFVKKGGARVIVSLCWGRVIHAFRCSKKHSNKDRQLVTKTYLKDRMVSKAEDNEWRKMTENLKHCQRTKRAYAKEDSDKLRMMMMMMMTMTLMMMTMVVAMILMMSTTINDGDHSNNGKDDNGCGNYGDRGNSDSGADGSCDSHGSDGKSGILLDIRLDIWKMRIPWAFQRSTIPCGLSSETANYVSASIPIPKIIFETLGLGRLR